MNDSPAASPLTHDAAFHEVGALALGALPREEERLVRAHVENCPLCSAELAAMSSVVGAMPTRPPGGGMDQRVSEGIRSRLLARAADRSTRRQSVGNVYRLLAIAAVLAAILLGVGYYRERAERRDLLASAARRDSVISALNSLVRDRDAELSAITGPGVSVVELSSTGIRPPTARMFWDRATNRWTLFAHGLSAPKPGRTYELWLVTADKKIPAGTFTPAGDGSAVVRATYALSPTELKAIAITDEPAGGVSAPTGAVILAGSAGS